MSSEFINCSDHIVLHQGPYLNNLSVSWVFTTEHLCLLSVSWLNFSTEEGYDFVSIFDPELNLELAKYSGISIPSPITSSGSSLEIRFVTDESVTDRGFRANITSAARPICGDGVVSGVETCDIGNYSSPGCIDCEVQVGWGCFELECTDLRCGEGICYGVCDKNSSPHVCSGPCWAEYTAWLSPECWLSGDALVLSQWPSLVSSLSVIHELVLCFKNLESTFECDNHIPSRVTSIDLRDRGLSGSLPSSLGQLSNLRHLDLVDNFFSGVIPSSLGQLSNLEYMDLSNNFLSGEIPAALGQLTQLWFLACKNNTISGEIPPTLGQLERMVYLDLGFNQLSGEIPAAFGSLISVRWMYLGVNHFSGNIPDTLGQMVSLEILYLYGNYLSGQIPSTFRHLSRMLFLLLSSNNLTGSTSTLGHISNLRALGLANNAFTGSIDAIASLPQLFYVWADNNRLSGNLPDDFDSSDLQTLLLQNNCLSGVVGERFLRRSSNALMNLDLSLNFLVGPLPAQVPQNAYMLNFASNRFTGVIPSWSTSKVVRLLDLSNNSLYETVPLYIDLVNFSFVNLSMQSFWNGSSAENSFIRLYNTDTNVGRIDTSNSFQRFRCPYPPPNPDVVWLRDPCDLNPMIFWILMGISVSGILAIIIRHLYFSSDQISASQGSEVPLELLPLWRVLLRPVITTVCEWVLEVADISSDIATNLAMLDFIDNYPFSHQMCQSLNKTFVPATQLFEIYGRYDGGDGNDGHTNFNSDGLLDIAWSDYLQGLWSLGQAYVYNWGLAPEVFLSIVDTAEPKFEADCSFMPGCIYNNVSKSCESNEFFHAFPTFRGFVMLLFWIVIFKESVKIICLFWCVCHGSAPPVLLPICRGSVGLPLLLLRPAMLQEVLLYELNHWDHLYEFIYDGCLENIPQFVMGIIYIVSVTTVGISAVQLVSLYLSVLSLMRQIYMGFEFLRGYNQLSSNITDKDQVELQQAGL